MLFPWCQNWFVIQYFQIFQCLTFPLNFWCFPQCSLAVMHHHQHQMSTTTLNRINACWGPCKSLTDLKRILTMIMRIIMIIIINIMNITYTRRVGVLAVMQRVNWSHNGTAPSTLPILLAGIRHYHHHYHNHRHHQPYICATYPSYSMSSSPQQFFIFYKPDPVCSATHP